MSARNSPRLGWLVGILGVVGFSAVIGILLTISVAPALALASVGTQSAIGVFDSIPDGFDLDDQPQRNEIYAQSQDAGGWKLVATVYDQNREEVPYDRISPNALNAAVAGEDRRFFEHGGVDISGIVRAAIGNAAGTGFQGASTITQQLVKQTFVQKALELPTEDERNAAYNAAIAPTIDRKVTEMRYAIALEKKYTKDEILTAYLNIANFGAATYGIEAASQRYFGIHASQLSIAQAASLVAIVQQPEGKGALNLSSSANFAANQGRRDYIIKMMYTEGYISAADRDAALAIPVDANFVANGSVPQQGCRTADVYARWMCDYIVKSVPDFAFLGANAQERQANWKQGGYKLYTTLDYDANKVATDALTYWTPPDAVGGNLGGTVSVVEPGTGRVRVMAENKVFDDAPIEAQANPAVSSSVNINTPTNRGGSGGKAPGSTYKLAVLVDWLENGHGINEVINGSEGTIPASAWTNTCGPTATYTFHNDAHESGDYTVQRGTWQSINGVFLRMATKLDLCQIGQVATSLGMQRADQGQIATGPADVIGSGNNSMSMMSMADAYATIAANGLHCQPIVIDSYVGPDGVSHPGQSPTCDQAVDPDIAATVAYTMSGTATNGTGVAANPHDGTPIFMKTGTAPDNQNRLVAGATSKNAMIVWTGAFHTDFNLQTISQHGVSGMSLRDRIFKTVMGFLDSRYGGDAFPKPSGKYQFGSSTSIPNVSGQGLTFAQASAILTALGFQVNDGGPVDSDQTINTIAQQDPAGGSKAGAGTTITLYESKQNMTSIPDVTGTSVDSAKQTLQSKGFNPGSVTYVCDSGTPSPHPTGTATVVSQDPAGGSLAVAGATVNLTAKLSGSDCVTGPGGPGGGLGGGGAGGGSGGGGH